MARLGTILSSALVVTVVGAILGFVFGLSAERVAREWQQEDKRLDVRTALVRRVSETTAEFIGVVRLRGIGAADERALDAAYRSWSVASSSIGGELRAYVRDDDVHARWSDYRSDVARVYYFFRAEQRSLRVTWLREIAKDWAPANQSGAFAVLNGLLEEPPAAGQPNPEYETSLRRLLGRLETSSEEVVVQVLAAATKI